VTRKIRAKKMIPAAALSAAAAVGLLGGVAGVAAAKSKSAAASVKVEKPASATIAEAGSSLLYPLWNLWVPGYNQKYSTVTIQTAAGGSGKGISGAANGTLQIGSSDAYLSTAQKQKTPTLLNIPLAISAQEIYYNIPGVTAHLKLSGKILAGMYTGKITKWNTTAIKQANPGVTLPTLPVVTLHRVDGSGDTFLFTTYLSDSTKTWSTKVGYNTTVTWPSAPGELAETGNSGMVAGCKATAGCVAYIGISYQTQALGDGLTYAQMANAKGQYVMPTATTIQKEAAGFTKKTPATGAISMIDGKVKTGYPIINYEYGIVNKKQSSTNEAKAVRSLLEWAIDPKGGNSATYMSQVGFRPLPTKVVAQSVKQIKSIK
jgi:phosphate transport system substrate-binding protein